MKKSPFSTPRGGAGNGTPSGYRWQRRDRGSRGYAYDKPTNISAYQRDPEYHDYLPFSQSEDKGRNNYYSNRGRRNRNFFRSPEFQNNPYSPHHRTRRPHRNSPSIPHREVPIDQYINMQMFNADPWRELTEKFNKLTSQPNQKDSVEHTTDKSATVEIEENFSSTRVKESNDSTD